MPDGKYVENLEARKMALDYAFRHVELNGADMDSVVAQAEKYYAFLVEVHPA